MKKQDEYKLDKTFTYSNAVVRIYRPIISEEEKEKRINNLKEATVRFMKAVLKENPNISYKKEQK